MEKYFDINYLWKAIPQIAPYVWITLLVALLAVLAGTFLGLVIAIFKLSKRKPLRFIANSYITIIRCTPSIVLLFLVYYGIPAFSDYFFGINLQDIHTGVYVVITFSLQFAAMMAEVIRSSYLAIDKGQYEAGVCVGLTSLQAYRRIVLPQAFVIALPNIGNGVIAVLQEGALAYTIGFIDIVGKANLIIANNYNTHTFEIYIALAIFYWILSIGVEKVFGRLEKAFSKGHRSLKTS